MHLNVSLFILTHLVWFGLVSSALLCSPLLCSRWIPPELLKCHFLMDSLHHNSPRPRPSSSHFPSFYPSESPSPLTILRPQVSLHSPSSLSERFSHHFFSHFRQRCTTTSCFSDAAGSTDSVVFLAWCGAPTAAAHAQYSGAVVNTVSAQVPPRRPQPAGQALFWLRRRGLGSSPLSQLEYKPNANIDFGISVSLYRYIVQWWSGWKEQRSSTHID